VVWLGFAQAARYKENFGGGLWQNLVALERHKLWVHLCQLQSLASLELAGVIKLSNRSFQSFLSMIYYVHNNLHAII